MSVSETLLSTIAGAPLRWHHSDGVADVSVKKLEKRTARHDDLKATDWYKLVTGVDCGYVRECTPRAEKVSNVRVHMTHG